MRRATVTARCCVVALSLAWLAPAADARAQASVSLAPLARRSPSGAAARAPAAAPAVVPLPFALHEDTSVVRETPHWVIPLFLLGGAGMGMIDGAVAGGAVPTRCFGGADRAAGNGAGAGLVLTSVAVAGSEVAWHVLRRRPASNREEEPLSRQGHRTATEWLLKNAALGAVFGAGTGALAGISRHAAAPQDCFRSAPSAALHGAALYGITGGVIFVPLAMISAS